MTHPRRIRLVWASLRGCVFFLPFCFVSAQEYSHSAAVYCNAVSSAHIFTSPFSADDIERNSTEEFGAVLSARVAYSYALSPLTRLQLGVEYISDKNSWTDNNGTPYHDGYAMYSGEICALFVLPFTGKTFQLFMGGGVGVYNGSREYSVAGIRSSSTRSKLAMNIITVFGLTYYLSPSFSLQAEFRFRDPHFTATNAFTQPSVQSNGVTYPLDTRPFQSRINVNGNVYAAGIAVHF